MQELDLSEFEDAPQPCSVGRALLVLSDDDRELFLTALATPRFSNAKILERFRVRGVSLGKDAVSRHRKGMCRCD